MLPQFLPMKQLIKFKMPYHQKTDHKKTHELTTGLQLLKKKLIEELNRANIAFQTCIF